MSNYLRQLDAEIEERRGPEIARAWRHIAASLLAPPDQQTIGGHLASIAEQAKGAAWRAAMVAAPSDPLFAAAKAAEVYSSCDYLVPEAPTREWLLSILHARADAIEQDRYLNSFCVDRPQPHAYYMLCIGLVTRYGTTHHLALGGNHPAPRPWPPSRAAAIGSLLERGLSLLGIGHGEEASP